MRTISILSFSMFAGALMAHFGIVFLDTLRDSVLVIFGCLTATITGSAVGKYIESK